MASIEKRGDYTYRITVSKGYDRKGRKIVEKKTITIDASLTPKQAEKEVQRRAMEFENAVKKGDVDDVQANRFIKKSFFSAQYNRLVSHRGKNRATMAVAHSILIAVYFVLSGHQFKDLGADYYNQFNREKKINSHIKQLSKLGLAIPDDVLREALSQLPDLQPHSA